jgi:hypothetical protein
MSAMFVDRILINNNYCMQMSRSELDIGLHMLVHFDSGRRNVSILISP